MVRREKAGNSLQSCSSRIIYRRLLPGLGDVAKSDPVACLTPFTLGNLRLPTDADKGRLKKNTLRAYISSGASRRPEMDSRQLKRLGDICKKLSRARRFRCGAATEKSMHYHGTSICSAQRRPYSKKRVLLTMCAQVSKSRLYLHRSGYAKIGM